MSVIDEYNYTSHVCHWQVLLHNSHLPLLNSASQLTTVIVKYNYTRHVCHCQVQQYNSCLSLSSTTIQLMLVIVKYNNTSHVCHCQVQQNNSCLSFSSTTIQLMFVIVKYTTIYLTSGIDKYNYIIHICHCQDVIWHMACVSKCLVNTVKYIIRYILKGYSLITKLLMSVKGWNLASEVRGMQWNKVYFLVVPHPIHSVWSCIPINTCLD